MIAEDPKTEATLTPPASARPRILRKLCRWTEHLLAALGLAFLVYHFCFEYTVIVSESMAPALKGTSFETGDGLLVEKVTGRFRSPRRWEIYFFYDSEGNPVAKRIVGLPGERLSLSKTQLLVNGQPLAIPDRLKYLKYYPFGNLAAGREVDCGREYFVLGDDSKDSYDSRFLGTVASKRLRGGVWLRVAPWPRAGWVL